METGNSPMVGPTPTPTPSRSPSPVPGGGLPPRAPATPPAPPVMAIAASPLASGEVSTEQRWEKTISTVTPGIVEMRVCSVRPFDGRTAAFSYATGFVVDKARGIILTNRHVVTTGPVDAEAIFLNKEEVPLVAIYRDPVHDFGFFRYDPTDVRFMEIAEIPLNPDGAKVGVEIRVIGNDAGEKLSILSGTLARLDREAPFYGAGEYSDCNTFYYGAASSTTGGSSGSPVINVAGQAVALNAGGKRSAASAFYLPLDRAVRALALLQRGLAVPRGTLQCVLKQKAFDEVRRLGLRPETEATVRAELPEETGMLVVEQVVNKGAADGVLDPGDVILKVNGVLCTTFLPLEEALDNARSIAEAVQTHPAPSTESEGAAAAASSVADAGSGAADTPKAAPASLPPAPHRPHTYSELRIVVSKATSRPAPVLTTHPAYTDDAASGFPMPGHYTPKAKTPTTPDTDTTSPVTGPAPSSSTTSAEGAGESESAAEGKGSDDAGGAVGASVGSATPKPLDPTEAFVVIDVERGGEPKRLVLPVQDLHEIVPSRYLEVSGAIMHEVSYQTARNNTIPCGGVHLAQAGYMFARASIPRGAVLVAVGATPTPTLDAMEAALVALHDNERTAVRFFLLGDVHRERVSVLQMDRTWLPMQMCTRNNITGFWEARRSAPPPPPKPQAPMTASFTQGPTPLATKVARSIVSIDFHVPFMVDGVHGQTFIGTGLVVDAARGLVVTDRNTVPMLLGDIMITVAGSVELPARVVFIHPVHNFSVLRYDPALLGDTPVATAELSDTPLKVGDTCSFVGVTSNAVLVAQQCLVTKCERVIIRDASPPRYRASNEDVYHFDRVTPCNGGYFSDAEGRVQAVWASYSYTSNDGSAKEMFRGLPIELVAEVVAPLREGRAVGVRSMDIELAPIALSTARVGMGLPDEWVRKLETLHDDRKHVLTVRRRLPLTDGYRKLREGDLLLAINNTTVAKFRDVERVVGGEALVRATILRDSAEHTVELATNVLDGRGTDRVVIWAGMMLQGEHRSTRERGYVPAAGGTYISRWCYGSPAHKYGIRATIWIIEVNGKPTPNLSTLLAVVREFPDRTSVRVRTENLQGKKKVFTLKTDLVYWPTLELKCDMDGKWFLIEDLDVCPPRSTLATAAAAAGGAAVASGARGGSVAAAGEAGSAAPAADGAAAKKAAAASDVATA